MNIFFKACAVMALERVPADIRKDGGVSRMSDPKVLIINYIVCRGNIIHEVLFRR